MIVWYDMKRYDEADKKKSKNMRISLFFGLGSLFCTTMDLEKRFSMLWSTRHTRLNKFPIQSRIADGHSVIITLHYKSEMKSSKPFFRRVFLVVQFEIRVDRRQRLICKCLKSSHKDWPLANSENPKDDNNARKRGQFFGESVFVTEAWEIWSPVFAPVWRLLSMWKCPIKLLWWFTMLIQYNPINFLA